MEVLWPSGVWEATADGQQDGVRDGNLWHELTEAEQSRVCIVGEAGALHGAGAMDQRGRSGAGSGGESSGEREAWDELDEERQRKARAEAEAAQLGSVALRWHQR